MKLYKTSALVLRNNKLKDANKLLTLYSPDYGKIKAVAYGVAKPKSRKRGAVQPFCYSNFLLYRGKELDSVSQCEWIELFPAIRSDLNKMAYVSYAVELVDRFTVEGEPNKEIFKLLLYTLYYFEREGDESFLRIFEAKLIKALGYMPSLDSCVNCGTGPGKRDFYFSLGSGGAICADCKDAGGGGIPVTIGLLKILSLLFSWDPVN
ncbi:MAG TPA: DNA repair protein RecO, partial [Clostridia bacterium]|nr:DNA repair protein RecO [Clostridia bacterium]